jgi:cell division protein FtsB
MTAATRVANGSRALGSGRVRSYKPNVRTRAKAPSGPAPKRGKLWLGLLALWLMFLSGAGTRWTGTPGVLQQLHLRSLLDSQLAEQADLQSGIDRLRGEADLLEHSKAVQQREIRRVLGYSAEDEIIFDFASPNERI